MVTRQTLRIEPWLVGAKSAVSRRRIWPSRRAVRQVSLDGALQFTGQRLDPVPGEARFIGKLIIGIRFYDDARGRCLERQVRLSEKSYCSCAVTKKFADRRLI